MTSAATYVHLLPDDLPDPDFLDELTEAREQERAEAETLESVTEVVTNL